MEENESIIYKQNKSLNKQKDLNNSIISESEVKIDLKKKRFYKSQNEILEKEISELTEICFGSKDNILTSKERLEEIKSEMKNRKEQRDKKQNQLNKIINDPFGKETGDYLKKQKQSLMRKHLDELICDKIPELGNNQAFNPKEIESYKNLMYEHIDVTFCDYDSSEISEAANLQKIRSDLNNNNNNNNINKVNNVNINYDSNNSNNDILQTNKNILTNKNLNNN